VENFSYTLSELAEIMYEFVEHLNLKSIILVGHGTACPSFSFLMYCLMYYE
ncbi:putative esterase, partial [Emiliania huxleyi virus 145]